LDLHAVRVCHRYRFSPPKHLADIYETLTRTAIHAVKPENVATFPGRKLNGNDQDEMGNDFHTRNEGTQSTTNDVSSGTTVR
jgi:hypothetical protein